jgi:hypothetical protein
MINKEDIITCKSYQKLADYIYEASTGLDNIPSSCIIWTSNDHLVDFFTRVKGNGNKYIVISSYSDFGLDYQIHDNPTCDMQRYFDLIKYKYPNIGYQSIQLPTCVDITKCNPSHKYLLKCHRFSHSSFDDIPDEIQHIFMVNCSITHPKITPIPFGVFEGKEEYFSDLELESIFKEPKIYVNFADYTLERSLIKKKLKQEIDRNTKLGQSIALEENTIPFEEYLSNIKKYLFILCPIGNGKDTFRALESIYCGSLPIYPYILHNIYEGYGISYSYDIIERIYHYLDNHEYYNTYLQDLYRTADYKQFKLSYWKEQIDKKRSLLC